MVTQTTTEGSEGVSDTEKAAVKRIVEKLKGLSKGAADQVTVYAEGFASGYACRDNEKREEEV